MKENKHQRHCNVKNIHNLTFIFNERDIEKEDVGGDMMENDWELSRLRCFDAFDFKIIWSIDQK